MSHVPAARLCATMAIMEPIHRDHSRINARSLAMHRLVAQKVRANPALLDKARENLRRWQKVEANAG